MIRTSSPGRRGDHGMVTAELALGSLIVAFLATPAPKPAGG